MSITDTDMSAIGKIIKLRRQALGLSARQLAEKVGVSDAHIIYIEKAQRRATFDKVANILNALGLSVDEVLRLINEDGEPKQGKSRQIPVVTWVKAGQWGEICDSFEPGDADDWIESDLGGVNTFALRVTGDSMEPEFHDGEIITINPAIEAQPGDYIVVKNSEGEATFKQLKKYGSRWVLHPLNPKYNDLEVRKGQFRVIGKVVKKEKRY